MASSRYRLSRRDVLAAGAVACGVLSTHRRLIAAPAEHVVVDVEQLREIRIETAGEPADRHSCEILVVGGSLGGIAAAIAATDAGRSVLLVEETAWLGGQATSQGVSALDENGWIETSGGTRGYLSFRKAIRDWYRRNAKLKPEAARKEHLNPGNGWVSRLCFEPKAALAVIDDLLAPATARNRLRVLKRCKAYAVRMEGDRVAAVDFVHLDSRERFRVTAEYVIDATELGDLLSLGAAEFVTGFESRQETGEPNAPDESDPEDVQSFTYPFAIEFCPATGSGQGPGERHSASQPADYARNVKEQPYSLDISRQTGRPPYAMFTTRQGTYGPFWTYRRLIDASQFDDPNYPNDIAMINWPGNDFRGGNILSGTPSQQIALLQAAKNLSLGLLWWLQHEVERDEGGRGYPEFKLRPDVMGSSDGLSKFPYIRESRRLRAVKTILEQEITTAGPRAVHFDDSVGIGLYSIDIHETTRTRRLAFKAARPFQVPLGALIARRTRNLLAGCKNIGTTHITNGCYRLHPVEWAIGEAAGETASFCIERGRRPKEILADRGLLRALQRRLVARGAPIMWYDDLPVTDPRFGKLQMLPFESPEVMTKLQANLHAPELPPGG